MVDGLPVEGTFRAHQLPLGRGPHQPGASGPARGRGSAATGPRSSSTTTGRRSRPSAAFPPSGERRMSANPHANGGLLLRRSRAARLLRLRGRGRRARARSMREATRVLGRFLRDVIRPTRRTFRLFGPDETVVQPAAGRVRGHRPDLGRRAADPATTTWPPTAG